MDDFYLALQIGASVAIVETCLVSWRASRAASLKRRVLLEVFRKEPSTDEVHGRHEPGDFYHTAVNFRGWNNRRLSALLVCLTEGLVERKEERYVLTEMGRLSFATPITQKRKQ